MNSGMDLVDTASEFVFQKLFGCLVGQRKYVALRLLPQEAVLKNVLTPEERETFTRWLQRRSLILITHLEEVTSRARVLVGAVHITWDVLQLPALQMLQVGHLTGSSLRGRRCALNPQPFPSCTILGW